VTQKIGSYDVLDLIGDGGMGAVYRGRDPRFDRLVAIKVLHSHFLRDPGVVERFKAEAVIQAKLSHPHIVTVFDFVAQADTLAIVMDLVDGLPLDELIERGKGPMAMDRAVRLMDQILSAMGYAHQRGLVHRDIKPSNILVLSVEGQEFAKVMDFGIAKILGSEKLQTATGAKMGTLAYMSPEHVRSPKHVDVRSDVYSLGVVLYEMLTGQVPFDADSEYELMRQIVQDDPRDIGQLPSRVGPALGGVVRKALAKDPAARFQSCTEMRQALGDRDERESLDRVAPASALPASLTGKVPFDAESEYEPMRQIVEDAPRGLARSALPKGFPVVVETALARDPSRRFASCEAMRRAPLDATAQGSAPAVAGGSPFGRTHLEIGRVLFDAVEQVGSDGVIRVVLDEAYPGRATVEVSEGCRFDSTCFLPPMVPDGEHEAVVLNAPFILLVGGRVVGLEGLHSLSQRLARGASLLVIAEDVEGTALPRPGSAGREGEFVLAAVAAGASPVAVLEDLSLLTGGLVAPSDLRPRGRYLPVPRDLRVTDLGRARTAVVGPSSTTLVETAGGVAGLESHVRKLRVAIDEATSDDSRDRLLERLARVVGGVAEVKIGLAGDRGREVREFLEELEGEPELLRSVWRALGQPRIEAFLERARTEPDPLRRAWRNLFHAREGARQ
jgi:hypothetical protein